MVFFSCFVMYKEISPLPLTVYWGLPVFEGEVYVVGKGTIA